MLDDIKKNMDRDNSLSKLACKNSEAIRFKKSKDDIRPPFFKDIDKINCNYEANSKYVKNYMNKIQNI